MCEIEGKRTRSPARAPFFTITHDGCCLKERWDEDWLVALCLLWFYIHLEFHASGVFKGYENSRDLCRSWFAIAASLRFVEGVESLNAASHRFQIIDLRWEKRFAPTEFDLHRPRKTLTCQGDLIAFERPRAKNKDSWSCNTLQINEIDNLLTV